MVSELCDTIAQSHEMRPFDDMVGATSGEEIQAFRDSVATMFEKIKVFRSAFVELVLVLAFDHLQQDAASSVQMIRDQVTDVTSSKDGVTAQDIQSVLYSSAKDRMK